MLFTDGNLISQAELLKIDSEVAEAAASSQPAITLTDILDDAQQEVGSYLLGIGQRFHGRWTNMYNGPQYGVKSIFTESANRPRYSLSQIVVTDGQYPMLWSDLKRYLVYVALYNFYRDASRRPGVYKDRYAEKRDVYQEEIRNKYLPRLIKSGIWTVGKPLACPGALYEAGVGTWDASNLSLVSGGTGLTVVPYDVAITWVDAASTQNNESAPSATATLTVGIGQQMSISIANLKAPNGQDSAAANARFPVSPMTATHWNVYAGVSGGTLTLQNISRIPYATKSYTLAIPPTNTGVQVGVGQYAEVLMTVQPNTIMRG